MNISAVILTYNSIRYIDHCIHSLAAAMPESFEKNEVFIVDNGSTDGTVSRLQRLKAEYPDLLHITYFDRNTGTTRSRNTVLRQCQGRYILIMDSDVEVPKNTIIQLMHHLDSNSKYGIIAPRLIYPDGRYQISTDVFPTVWDKILRFFFLKKRERTAMTKNHSETVTAVDYAISAFWMLRRDVIERVGLFDERIFYSPEDVDYCIRVWAAGYKVVYCPAAYAIHDAQEISRKVFPSLAALSHIRGLFYLFYKHHYGIGSKRLYRSINRYNGEHCNEPT